MKRIVLPALFLLTVVGVAHADQFQFLYKSGDETYYVSYSNVEVYDANNETVFKGYTDKYGRITMESSNGHYNANVFYKERWWRVVLVINGSKELKRVYLEQE